MSQGELEPEKGWVIWELLTVQEVKLRGGMYETVVVGLARGLGARLKTYLIFPFLVTCLLYVCEGAILFLLLFVFETGSC